MLTAPSLQTRSIDFSIRKISGNLQFTEGPCWHPNGFLLFSDLPANKMYRWFPGSGSRDIFINDSGLIGSDTSLLSKMIGSNGTAIDKNKNIIFCQHGNHAIACLNTNNELKFLTCMYGGKPYNSPNDLAIKSDGSIYFNDPPYGLKDETLNVKLFQPCAGIYRYRSGKVDLLHSELARPNGICFSPDEKFLYVSNSDSDQPAVHRFHLSPDGNIVSDEIFMELHCDGMHCDKEGNLLMACKDGIVIVNENGEWINKIKMDGTPSNITPGEHGNYFVTAGDSVWLLELID